MDTEEYSHLTCTIHLLLKFKISPGSYCLLHQQIILLLFNVSEFLVDINKNTIFEDLMED